jgi:hypothetical protein
MPPDEPDLWFLGLMRALTVAASAGLIAALTITVSAYADPLPSPSVSSATPSSGSATATASSTAEAQSPTPTAGTESTSPTPEASPTATSTATATAEPEASATSEASRPTPAKTPQRDQATPPAAISLSISAGGTPQPGRYFEDIGYYAIRGTTAAATSGQRVEIYWYSVRAKKWQRSVELRTTAGGRYSHNQPVGHAQSDLRFVATLGGAPGVSGVRSSRRVSVDVVDASVVLTRPVKSIDSLKNPTLSGYVVPARPGVRINLDVRRPTGAYRGVSTVTTDAKGRFSGSLSYGRGNLATYTVRSSYRAANRDRWEKSATHKITRAAVLNAKITRTTAAEVAKTYRRGCPVGPSKLRTVTMNFYGRDRKMHRGVIIVRSDLTSEVIRGFNSALTHRFPIAKMNNPNVYGGNDPRQMEANNTSGFNCRKVVGNPYAQSPHSYGIAVDVTPVQNPFRDRNGKWWPSNGRSYIDRSPRRFGMLTRGSYLTKQLAADGFFWGGRWSPGRDYQHFEYDR